MVWWVAVPVVMEGRDFLEELGNRRYIEKLVDTHCRSRDGNIGPGTVEIENWVLVIRELGDGRLILHARDKSRDGARSSDAVREYYCDPISGTLKNCTIRQAFGWKANLKH